MFHISIWEPAHRTLGKGKALKKNKEGDWTNILSHSRGANQKETFAKASVDETTAFSTGLCSTEEMFSNSDAATAAFKLISLPALIVY